MTNSPRTIFHGWLMKAAPGDSIIYYSGNLTEARGDIESILRRGERTPALDEADAAWFAANAGLVNLVQRAVGPIRANGTHTLFQYIAQRTSNGRRADPPTA